MVTMKDVALQAKVSVATVSRVINNKGYVSEKSRRSVLESIDLLNYRPNEIARSLSNKRSKMIGILVPDIVNPFFPALARAIENIASKHGYLVTLCNTDGNMEKEKEYLNVLKQNYVDGIIITSNNLDLYKDEELNLPIVALDRALRNNVSTVVTENYKGAKLAAKHLLECGCKKIAHITGTPGLSTSEERMKGFVSICNSANVDHLIKHSNFNREDAESATYQLLREHPDIDGIFTGSDVMASGVMKALYRMGYRVPHDVKVIGFDGVQLGEMLTPSLTTIEQPIDEMGTIATTLLINQMERNEITQEHVELPTKLLIRETTKPLTLFESASN